MIDQLRRHTTALKKIMSITEDPDTEKALQVEVDILYDMIHEARQLKQALQDGSFSVE